MMSSKDVYEMDNTTRFAYLLMSAISIIKEKRVDVDLLLMFDNVEDYNKHCHKYINVETQLTQEEYDLLKEVLTNEIH